MTAPRTRRGNGKYRELTPYQLAIIREMCIANGDRSPRMYVLSCRLGLEPRLELKRKAKRLLRLFNMSRCGRANRRPPNKPTTPATAKD